MSSNAVLCILKGSSTKVYTVLVSFILPLICVLSKIIFSVALSISPWISTMSENLNVHALERPFAIEIFAENVL